VCLAQIQAGIEVARLNGCDALELADRGGVVTLMQQCDSESHAHRRRRAGQRERLAQHALGLGVPSEHEVSEPEAFQRRAMRWRRGDGALEQGGGFGRPAFEQPCAREQP
jgi:hypothetical protein